MAVGRKIKITRDLVDKIDRAIENGTTIGKACTLNKVSPMGYKRAKDRYQEKATAHVATTLARTFSDSTDQVAIILCKKNNVRQVLSELWS